MRNVIDLNVGWQFTKENAGLPASLPAWESVDLPHSWNAVDGCNGCGNVYRGTCWYAREFDTPVQPLPGGRVYVEIKAASLDASVYVNGQKVIYHEGGFSIFRADVTDLCRADGKNLLVVECNNAQKSNVYPQMADFTFYGGLYRGVNIISVPAAHFDLDHCGGCGLKVTPKPTECGGATFEVESWIVGADENFTVMYSVADADGKELASAVRPVDAAKTTLFVPDARLWDVDDPYLYTVTATLVRRNEHYDQVSARAGVRSFSCDPQKGFFLNGRSLPLRGVSRHQDQMYKGWALTRAEHFEDARIIKELGANNIRLAHYQHSPDFYDACDELGLIVWAEIPFISNMSDDPAAHENCRSMMTELIIQNYNHPCIMFWGLSNEILIGGMKPGLVENHKDLNALVKSLDDTRLTTIAHVSMTPSNSPLHHITDVESYNHYFGWYGGKLTDNEEWFDKFHAEHPDICIGLSEYGCEGIVTYHTTQPACKDYTEEYQCVYHEHLMKIISERPWIWSTQVWNMFDFGCTIRDEGGVQGRNNKGLMTMDRKIKKDAYFLYNAYWSKKPMVHLCGRRYAQRAGETTEIKVYSNQPAVTLYLNGEKVGEQTADKVFKFTVALAEGNNILVADAGGVKDSMSIEKVAEEPAIYTLPEFKEKQEGVANWFKLMGPMDLDEPMQFPEGYYSIKDSMETLAENEEAFKTVASIVTLATGFKVEKGVGMWSMLSKMSPEAMMQMAGDSLPKGFLESLNAKLTKIKKG